MAFSFQIGIQQIQHLGHLQAWSAVNGELHRKYLDNNATPTENKVNRALHGCGDGQHVCSSTHNMFTKVAIGHPATAIV